MRVDDFTARRRAGWLELETAIAQTERRRRDVTTTELQRLGRLYRRAAGDLAIARRDHPGEPVTDYLNGVCSRAHPLVFRGAPLTRRAPIDLFRVAIPTAFRQSLPYMALSAALLLAGALAGWAAVELRPDLRDSLVPVSLFDQMASGQLQGRIPDAASVSPVIIFNNVRVALLLFAGGVLLGVPTAVALLVNGWILGTLAAAVHSGGYDLAFWSLIAPHGVLELSIIAIAGGAGLMVGDSLLRPGLRRRADALTTAAGTAARLVIAAAVLLVVAGVLEGYVSPSGLPEGAKLGVGSAAGALLLAWLFGSGRRSSVEAAAAEASGPRY